MSQRKIMQSYAGKCKCSKKKKKKIEEEEKYFYRRSKIISAKTTLHLPTLLHQLYPGKVCLTNPQKS